MCLLQLIHVRVRAHRLQSPLMLRLCPTADGIKIDELNPLPAHSFMKGTGPAIDATLMGNVSRCDMSDFLSTPLGKDVMLCVWCS